MPDEEKTPTSYRLTEEARQLLAKMAAQEPDAVKTGISITRMLEILIREGAKKRKIKP